MGTEKIIVFFFILSQKIYMHVADIDFYNFLLVKKKKQIHFYFLLKHKVYEFSVEHLFFFSCLFYIT